MKKKVLSFVIACCLVMTFAGCGERDINSAAQTVVSDTEKEVKEEAEEKIMTGEKPTPEENAFAEEFVNSSVYTIYVNELKESQGDYIVDISFNRSERTVCVVEKFGDPNVALTKSDEQENLNTLWNNLVESMRNVSLADKEYFEALGYEVSVLYQGVSETNNDRLLFTVKDGAILFNCLAEGENSIIKGKSDIAFYDECPDAPDYGELFNVEPIETDGNDFIMIYTYASYDGYIDDYGKYGDILKDVGYELDVELMYEYDMALENSGEENTYSPMLFSNGKTVIYITHDYINGTFDVVVSSLAMLENYISQINDK